MTSAPLAATQPGSHGTAPAGDGLVLVGGEVHTGSRVLDDGWLALVAGRVAGSGTGPVPERWADLERRDVAGHRVVAGFVDLHCHGGAGVGFDESSAQEDVLRAIRLHRSHGTTTLVGSLTTAAVPALGAAVGGLADLVADGELAGVHLEGPWLSPHHRGAHDPRFLVDPVPADIDTLLSSGVVRVVTLAPELPGGLDAVRRVVGHGAVAAVGHTGADAATTTAAVDAGARLATHLFNAMAPVHHRAPGPVLALLEDERVVVELIADGVHLHPLTLAHAVRTAGPGRVALVTDAIAAAGMPDGEYALGGLAVDVIDRVARLRDPSRNGAIAGSTLTLDLALRYATDVAGLPFAVALAAVTSTPASVLGLADAGHLEEGARADVVVLDPRGVVRAVWRGGQEVGTE